MTTDINCIFKLGGSAITVKQELETLNEEGLRKACKLVQACVRNGQRCIVVHGAGSFGHHHARQYKVKEGYKHLCQLEQDKVKYGFCLTRQSVTKLNHIVLESLLTARVNAISISPGPCGWSTSSGKLISYDVESIQCFIGQGFIPVLHGDCVLDIDTGCFVLSGDTEIKVLCEELPVRRVVFVSDVNGVFDKPPHLKDSNHIRRIHVDKYKMTSKEIKTHCDTAYDVTGGLQFKLDTCVDIVSTSKSVQEVVICNIHSDLPTLESVCCSSDIKESDLYTVIK